MKEIYQRTIGLISEDNFNLISTKRIAVIGLGGVGGTALEALARTGFQHFVILDFDKVSSSNLNRQILYVNKDIDKYKVDAAKEKITSINPDAEVITINEKVNGESINKLSNYQIDFIVDAIDDVNGKLAIAKYAKENNIPFIMSLGMANRIDPSKVEIIRLDKTTNDPLAKKIRHEIKSIGLSTNDIMTVCSSETPVCDGTALNSIMSVPSSAGLNIASFVLNTFIKK